MDAYEINLKRELTLRFNRENNIISKTSSMLFSFLLTLKCVSTLCLLLINS